MIPPTRSSEASYRSIHRRSLSELAVVATSTVSSSAVERVQTHSQGKGGQCFFHHLTRAKMYRGYFYFYYYYLP